MIVFDSSTQMLPDIIKGILLVRFSSDVIQVWPAPSRPHIARIDGTPAFTKTFVADLWLSFACQYDGRSVQEVESPDGM